MERRAQIQDEQRTAWDQFSSGWAKWDDVVHQMLAPVGEEMIRSLELREDARHLDIASGTGEPGLSVARRVPNGHVVLTDLSAGMLAEAAAIAAARGIANIDVRQCGADELPFDDASFDSVTCRFGLMFFPDIPAALAELARVLRPGGRLSAAVWAEPAGNPWATIPLGAIGEQIDLPAPDPDAPGLFRCSRPGAISDAFRAAGLGDVAETDVRGTLDLTSGEQYWAYMNEIAAPVVAALGPLDEAGRARVREATLERIRPFETDGRPAIPTHARCIVGTR